MAYWVTSKRAAWDPVWAPPWARAYGATTNVASASRTDKPCDSRDVPRVAAFWTPLIAYPGCFHSSSPHSRLGLFRLDWALDALVVSRTRRALEKGPAHARPGRLEQADDGIGRAL